MARFDLAVANGTLVIPFLGTLRGDVDQVVSDHACCMAEQKGSGMWEALPGFGGSGLIDPVLVSEGCHRRGLRPERVAELASGRPARNAVGSRQ